MKKCYTRLYLFLPLFIFCFVLLKYSNVNAASLTALPSGRFYRAWSQNSGNTWQHNANYTDWVVADLPISALSANATYDRYVKGFRVVGNPPEASSSYTVNQITEISVIFRQLGTFGDCSGGNDMYPTLNYRGTGFVPFIRYISGNNVLETETFNYNDNFKCYEEISGNGNAIIEFKFNGFSTTDNSPINGLDFRWGDALTTPSTASTVGIAGICKTGTFNTSCFLGNTIQFMGITYKYTLSNDPAIIYQNTIINQNNTQINQNQQIIDNQNAAAQQDQEDRDNISDTAQDAQDSADSAQDQNEQATSSLLDTMGSLFTALGTPATDCKVNADLGNIDLGEIDYCSGKPAAFEPIINSVCIMIMAIPIYLIARDLMLRFIYLTSYAQGGDNVR